jgi:hypothetical protein
MKKTATGLLWLFAMVAITSIQLKGQTPPPFISNWDFDEELITLDVGSFTTYYVYHRCEVNQLNKLFRHCRIVRVFGQSGAIHVVRVYGEYFIMKCYRILPAKTGMANREFAILVHQDDRYPSISSFKIEQK